MGAGHSVEEAPAYQPSYMEQHVKAMRSYSPPQEHKKWQGVRPGHGWQERPVL